MDARRLVAAENAERQRVADRSHQHDHRDAELEQRERRDALPQNSGGGRIGR